MAKERFLPQVIDPDLCQLCGRCLNACRNEAIVIEGRKRWVDYRRCTGCLTCTLICPKNAIKVTGVNEGQTLGVDIDAAKCHAVKDCHECVDRCPAGIYTKPGENIIVVEENLVNCKTYKICEHGFPANAVKVIQA
nr:4Fe-4S binding protein [Candidatus Sigynarchaeota archaeon]